MARFGQTFEEVAVPAFATDERWRSVERMISDPSGPARARTRTHEVLHFMVSTCFTGATVTDVETGRRLAYEGGGEGTTVRGCRRV